MIDSERSQIMQRTIASVAFSLSFTVLTFSMALGVDQKTTVVGKQSQIVQPPKPLPPKPGVVYATTSLNCGSKSYNLSTGNGKGECLVDFQSDGKTPRGATCNDGKGNYASAYCGMGGCVKSTGNGSCTQAKQ